MELHQKYGNYYYDYIRLYDVWQFYSWSLLPSWSCASGFLAHGCSVNACGQEWTSRISDFFLYGEEQTKHCHPKI